MGYNISAYVERKNKETGEWELVTAEPIASNLKYVFTDYRNYAKVTWDEISKELQKRYKKEKGSDGNEYCYASFYARSVKDLESDVSNDLHNEYTKLNVMVKALGCTRIYSDDGDELEYGGDETSDKLTFPVNKQLVEDIQIAFDHMRNIGQKEMFDLIVSDHVDWDDECRVVFALT